MSQARPLFLEVLHPFNFVFAWVTSFFRPVWYWRRKLISERIVTRFRLMDSGDHFNSDTWHDVSEEIAREWRIIACNPKLTPKGVTLSIAGGQIDFRNNWLQHCAIDFNASRLFLEMVSRYAAQNPGGKTTAGVSPIYLYLVSIGLYRHPTKGAKISKFWTQINFWFSKMLAASWLMREIYNLHCTSKTQHLYSHLRTYPIQFFWAGMTRTEAATQSSDINFTFVAQRGLSKLNENIYFVPPSLSEASKQWLDKNSHFWIEENFASAALSPRLRRKLLKTLILRLIKTPFVPKIWVLPQNFSYGLGKSYLWYFLGLEFKPQMYLSNVSNSWPDSGAVPALNSLGVRTVCWHYSANVFTYNTEAQTPLAQTPLMEDLNVDSSIQCSKEVWVWNKGQAQWSKDRNILPPEQSPKIQICGPIMCGDSRLLKKSRAELASIYHLDIEESDFVLAFFDVPLFTAESRRKRAHVPSRYKPDTMNQIREDLEALLARHPTLKLLVKPKRKRDDAVAGQKSPLIDWYSRLESSKRALLLAPESDPYAAISIADACLGPPFTSPVFAALEIGKPGIYYDPFFEARSFKFEELRPLILSSREALFSEFDKMIQSKPTPVPRATQDLFCSGIQDPGQYFAALMHSQS